MLDQLNVDCSELCVEWLHDKRRVLIGAWLCENCGVMLS